MRVIETEKMKELGLSVRAVGGFLRALASVSFETMSTHTALISLTNSKSAPFTVGLEVYLKDSAGVVKATSGVQTVTIPAMSGTTPGSASKACSVTMPTLTVASQTFSGWVAITYEGAVIATLADSTTVTVVVTPVIGVGPIVWS